MPLEVQAVVVGLEASIEKAMAIAGKSAKIDLGASSKAIDSLSQPLGRITGQADQFGKSMEAANARVLAFGASVGILNEIVKGFKGIISSTIEVEDRMASINTIFNKSTAELNKFKNEIFDIAKNTGTSFDSVSQAAKMLASQGLDANEMLVRLSDSMKLSRTSGMDASQSVEALTAAVNDFSKEGITTSEVLNKIASASKNFRVNQKDIADAFKVIGPLAGQAGISFDQLGGMIVALEAKTQRSGANIGNTIRMMLTSVDKSANLTALKDLGVTIEDVSGKVLPATKLFENLAARLKTATSGDSKKIEDALGGTRNLGPVLQVLSEYADKTSNIYKATKKMSEATNEADTMVKALNLTLGDALNRTETNLKQLGDALGSIGASKSLQGVLSFFDNLATKITEVLNGEGMGSDLAKGLVKGISAVISGPGLMIFGAIIAKLTIGLITFGTESLKSFFAIGQAQKEINNLASSLTQTLMNNENIHKAVLSLEGDHVAQARLLSTIINNNVTSMEKFVSLGARLGPDVYNNIKASGTNRAAGGYMPAVAQENTDIQNGVGGAGPSDRPVVIPNFSFGGGKVGTMVANDGEYVVNNYGGSDGSAILNKDMVSRIGLPSNAQKINAARGFVPNFADINIKGLSASEINGRIQTGVFSKEDAYNAGYRTSAEIKAEKDANKVNSLKDLTRINAGGRDFGMIVGERGIGTSASRYADNEGRITETQTKSSKYLIDVPIFRINDEKLKFKSTDKLTSQLSKISASAALKMAKDLSGGVLPEPENIELVESLLNKGSLTATAGAIFEAGIAGTLKDNHFKDFKAQDRNSLIDFRSSPQLKTLFNVTEGQAKQGLEAKANAGLDLVSSTAGKILKVSGYGDKKSQLAFGKSNAASGYIPNFANYIYDSDKLPAELRASILPAILASGKRKDGILGPAGSGKSTMAGGIGQFIQSMEDVAKATGFTILSGAALAKTPTGISKQFQPILNAIKSSGGSLKYLNVGDAEIKKRREARVATGSNDLRSEAQLKGSSFAPLNQPEFLDILKKEMAGHFQMVNGARGYVPNFADSLKEAISREVGAGVNPSQVYVDQNSSLANSNNPMGLMVANRRDEPQGGWQGIDRARKEGANITAYGAARGFVPNYANITTEDIGNTSRKVSQALDLLNQKIKELNTEISENKIKYNDAKKSLTVFVSDLDVADKNVKQKMGSIASERLNQPDKPQKDMLGTIFAVQAGLTLLSGATSDATSMLGKLSHVASDTVANVASAGFAYQGFSQMAEKSGGGLGQVFGKLGMYGAIAAGAFELFKGVAEGINEVNGSNKLAAENSAKLAESAKNAAMRLDQFSPTNQNQIKQQTKDIIYNLENGLYSLSGNATNSGNYINPESKEAGKTSNKISFAITKEEQLNLDSSIQQALSSGVQRSEIAKEFASQKMEINPDTRTKFLGRDAATQLEQKFEELSRNPALKDFINYLDLIKSGTENISKTIGSGRGTIDAFVPTSPEYEAIKTGRFKAPSQDKQLKDYSEEEKLGSKIQQATGLSTIAINQQALDLQDQKVKKQQELTLEVGKTSAEYAKYLRMFDLEAANRRKIQEFANQTSSAELKTQRDISDVMSAMGISAENRADLIKQSELLGKGELTKLKEQENTYNSISSIVKDIQTGLNNISNPEKLKEFGNTLRSTLGNLSPSTISSIATGVSDGKPNAEVGKIVNQLVPMAIAPNRSDYGVNRKGYLEAQKAYLEKYQNDESQRQKLTISITNEVIAMDKFNNQEDKSLNTLAQQYEIDKKRIQAASQLESAYARVAAQVKASALNQNLSIIENQGKSARLDIEKQTTLQNPNTFKGMTNPDEIFAKTQAIEADFFERKRKLDLQVQIDQAKVQAQAQFVTLQSITALGENSKSTNENSTAVKDLIAQLKQGISGLNGSAPSGAPGTGLMAKASMGVSNNLGVAIDQIAKNESNFNTKDKTGSNYGAFQMSRDMTQVFENDKQWDDYVQGTYEKQKEYYVKFLNSERKTLFNAGVDMSKLSPENQVGVAQGLQFSPSGGPWLNSFAAGNGTIPSTVTAQSTAMGNKSIDSMSKIDLTNTAKPLMGNAMNNEAQALSQLKAEDRDAAALKYAKETLGQTGEQANKTAETLTALANTFTTLRASSEQYKTTEEKRAEGLAKGNEKKEFGTGYTEGMAAVNTQIKNFDYELGKKIPQSFSDNMAAAMDNMIFKGKDFKTALMDAARSFLDEITKASFKNIANIVTSGLSSGLSSIGSSVGSAMRFASGGQISGGSGTKDDVPAMLMGGEFVINKASVSKYGPDFLNQLNKGTLSHFASGGEVTSKYAIQSGGLGSSTNGVYEYTQSGEGGNLKINDQVPIQTGQGGFQMPGYYGQGQISGRQDLTKYAAQAYTSGANDRVSSDADPNAASINLEGESMRLTTFGRTNGPMAQAIAESKKQALGLSQQEYRQEQDAEKAKKESANAFRKSLLMAVGSAVASAGISAGVNGAVAGFNEAAADPGATMGSKIAGAGSGVFSGGMVNGVQVGGLGNLVGGNFKLSQMSSAQQLDAYMYGNGTSSPYSKAVQGYSGPSTPLYQQLQNVPARATGGSIPETTGVDTVPTMLSGGEFVMNSAATQKIGANNLNAMNSGADAPSKDSSQLNDKLISKLDELIKITKESSKPVTVNVSSDAGASNTKENKKEENTSQQDRDLNRKIKEAVVKVMQDEKRLGGTLRSM